jgi:hypothetical protein
VALKRHKFRENGAYFGLSERGSSLLADSTTKNSFWGARPINGAKTHFHKEQTSISKLIDDRLSPEWIFMRFSRIFAYFSPRWVYFPDFRLFQSILADFGQLQLISAIHA